MEENKPNRSMLFAGIMFWIVAFLIMWGVYEFLLTQLR